MLTGLASAAPDMASIKTEIVSMGGARGAVSDSGLTLVDTQSGEGQIALDDVASVKQVKAKSHTGRNILIGVGIGVGAVAIAIVALAHKVGYL
jgi:hypothetical protein